MDDSGVENLTDAVLSLAVAPLGKARDTSINRGPRPNGIRALFAISELHSCTQLQLSAPKDNTKPMISIGHIRQVFCASKDHLKMDWRQPN